MLFASHRLFKSAGNLRAFFAFALLLLLAPALAAQDAATTDLREAEKKYNDAAARLRIAIAETNRSFALYYDRGAGESDKWKEQWQKSGEAGVLAARELKEAAVEILMNAKEPGKDVIAVGYRVCKEHYKNARYSKAYEIATRLVELDDRVEYQLERAKAALFTNHYDVVKSFSISHGNLLSQMPELESALLGQLDSLKQSFDQELEIREQEKIADDLPRVELETTKGKIVIELFENEAPETVGNFVNLVELGFYDGIVFHLVEQNFLAQAGGFTDQGPINVGYKIYDEHKNKGARKHFRGSISMASQPPEPNTGSSQFFIMTIPFSELDDHHTVFGRVVSGMEVVDSLDVTVDRDDQGNLKPIEDCSFDKIIRAKMLRKRDHEYKPRMVTE